MPATPRFQDLPLTLLRLILSYVSDGESIGHLEQCCISLRDAATDDSFKEVLWKNLHNHRWSFHRRRRRDNNDETVALDKMEYKYRCHVDGRAMEILKLLLVEGDDLALDQLMESGKLVIDVMWRELERQQQQQRDNRGIDEVREEVIINRNRLIRIEKIVIVLQQYSIFEDLVDLRQRFHSTDKSIWLEDFMILSSLLYLDRPLRNYQEEVQRVRDLLSLLADKIVEKFPYFEHMDEDDRRFSLQERVDGVNKVLFAEDGGFRGNVDDYYNLKNSLLHVVLKERMGIPMSLAIVYKCVCRRVGIHVDILGLPGHIIVATRPDSEQGQEEEQRQYLDVYRRGRRLTMDDIRAIANRYNTELHQGHLRELETRKVLYRVCNNIKHCCNRDDLKLIPSLVKDILYRCRSAMMRNIRRWIAWRSRLV